MTNKVQILFRHTLINSKSLMEDDLSISLYLRNVSKITYYGVSKPVIFCISREILTGVKFTTIGNTVIFGKH